MKQTIKVYRDLMGANEEWAARTRELLRANRLVMLNLIGSPGSGKTALLESVVTTLGPKIRIAVLEGDLETTKDAERLQKLDIPVSQLLTSGACHLEAKLVHYALRDLPLKDVNMVVVENVGNLVCPAEFDIGETMKLAVLSVTEGEEKALKYPLLFREAQAVVLTKTDLLPHLSYNIDLCMESIRQINPKIPIFPLSALQGEGLVAWITWLEKLISPASQE